MTIPYASPQGLIAAAQEKFEKHLPEVLALRPDAKPSHIGFDCADEETLAHMQNFGQNLGDVASQQTSDKVIVFIKLHQPINYQNYTLPYLELIGPDQDATKRRPTGIRAFVSEVNNVTLPEAEKIPSAKDPAIILRFQNKSAATLSGLGL